MKKIFSGLKKLAIIALSALAIGSCTDLYEDNFTERLSTSFTQPTAQDIAGIVGAAYSGWLPILNLWDGFRRVQEAPGDQMLYPQRPNGWVDGGKFQRMHRHLWTTTDEIVLATWDRTFNAIATCNRIVYLVSTDFIDMAEAKTTTLAELRVLRAAYYYILCDMYGNVPIDTLYDVAEGYVPVQNTRQEVFNFIVSEITNNVDNLSAERSDKYYGRFNQWAARTILAKMYLNAEVYTGTPMWDKCQEQCDMIINSGAGYILEANQKNVFATENQFSPEIIFGVAIDEVYTPAWNANDIHMQSLAPASQATFDLTLTPWGGPCATPQFIDTFDPEDKRLTKNYFHGQQFSSSGDSLFTEGHALNYINTVNPIEAASPHYYGYRFGKYEIAPGSTNVLNVDFPFLRYADILFMKAECLLRTGHADGAAALVTQVRARSFENAAKAVVTGAELLAGSSYDYGLRDQGYLGTTTEGGADIQYGRFLDELAWEFDQEGRRRQDMIRFGIFTKKSFHSHAALADDHTELYPIPTKAMETNAALKQNPGY